MPREHRMLRDNQDTEPVYKSRTLSVLLRTTGDIQKKFEHLSPERRVRGTRGVEDVRLKWRGPTSSGIRSTSCQSASKTRRAFFCPDSLRDTACPIPNSSISPTYKSSCTSAPTASAAPQSAHHSSCNQQLIQY
jgi:hypothetical protein